MSPMFGDAFAGHARIAATTVSAAPPTPANSRPRLSAEILRRLRDLSAGSCISRPLPFRRHGAGRHEGKGSTQGGSIRPTGEEAMGTAYKFIEMESPRELVIYTPGDYERASCE